MNIETFESFDNGQLRLPEKTIAFDKIEWSKHPVFEGVELKHIITAKDTNGEYSYHLVKIAPQKAFLITFMKLSLKLTKLSMETGYASTTDVSLFMNPALFP